MKGEALEHHTPSQEESLQVALQDVLRASLASIAALLAAFFAFFAFNHLWLLTGRARLLMAATAAGTALFFLLAALVMHWRPPPLRWTYPVAAGMGAVVLGNALLHLYLMSDPLQTTNLLLLLIGVGFLFLRTLWWAGFVLLSWVGWLLVVLHAPPDRAWQHFGIAMASATLLSWVVHRLHRRNFQRIYDLQAQGRVQQAALEEALRAARRTQRALETTLEVGQYITAILDLDALLNQVTEVIRDRYGFYYVGVFLVDEEDDDYVVARAGSGAVGRAIVRRGLRLRIGRKGGEPEGIIGWTARSRRLTRVNDVTQDERFIPAEEVPNTYAELALPLMASGKLLGVLDIQSDRRDAFRDEDLPVLESLAGVVAGAIRNATLYQLEHSQRMLAERLYSVGRALSRTLDLARVLEMILEQLADLVPYDRGSVLLERDGELVFFAARGFPEAMNLLNLSVSIHEGDIYDEIRRTQRPLLIPEVQKRADWQYIEGLPPAQSWLGVPLIAAERVMGMLSLARERVDPYTEDDVTLAAAFAGQAAIALENARLYDHITQVNRKLEMTVAQLQERTQELELAYSQLERLDRTKSDFIAVASHELRTPLTVLSGYSQMLLQDETIRQSEYYTQLVQGIQAGTERLHKIVDSMLDMAKIDSRELKLHPEPLDLHMLLSSIQRQVDGVLRQRKLTLTLEPMDDLPWIQADREALRKVFYHLINNAIKYTPDGGEITITGRALAAGEYGFAEGGVEIVVRDTGIGIDPRWHELIFAKFYQLGETALHSSSSTRFKGGGPGLGLAIARGIVEAHGGRIWVESPGYDEQNCPGSSFHVALPLSPSALLENLQQQEGR